MNLITLLLYVIVNVAMVLSCLLKKNRVYEFPFWAGVLALGWFFPMALGGYVNVDRYPGSAYAMGMLFASLCTIALWAGFNQARQAHPSRPSWLDIRFNRDRLIQVGILLSAVGFYFVWKLNSLPEELLRKTQWTGATVKYLFLAKIGTFGFLVLWLLYLDQKRLFAPKLLVFIAPTFLSLLTAALGGRRGIMMSLASYIFISLWFVRRFSLPRWMLCSGVLLGLALVNSIQTYRIIMDQSDTALTERLKQASSIDFTQGTESALEEGGGDFNNYIFLRQVVAEDFQYDYGLRHWNGMIFNFVPAQWVGRELKNTLMYPFSYNAFTTVSERYGHNFGVGSVTTGYYDAFASFGWLGFLKFGLVGWLMGMLYRHAMKGDFLGMLLYVSFLSNAMHAISHGTQAVLVSEWGYFLLLGYPAIHLAKLRSGEGQTMISSSMEWETR